LRVPPQGGEPVPPTRSCGYQQDPAGAVFREGTLGQSHGWASRPRRQYASGMNVWCDSGGRT
jgi:hypothetical protein